MDVLIIWVVSLSGWSPIINRLCVVTSHLSDVDQYGNDLGGLTLSGWPISTVNVIIRSGNMEKRGGCDLHQLIKCSDWPVSNYHNQCGYSADLS